MVDADACYLARGKLSDRANGPKGFTIKYPSDPTCFCVWIHGYRLRLSGVFTRKDADAGYLARGKLSHRANGPKGFTIKPLVFVFLLAL